jgi:ribosomal protein S12 methylthiotransferase accessory factor YcaO
MKRLCGKLFLASFRTSKTYGKKYRVFKRQWLEGIPIWWATRKRGEEGVEKGAIQFHSRR